MRARTAVPLAAVAPAVVGAVALALKAGRWRLYADRHRIELTPRPRRACPDCRGAGGWRVGGANPEMEACGCWAMRRELRIGLLPLPATADEPPF
ncbi:hypothetical protein [Streptomyces sp. 3N207]|uniref:hypothetical protein n=1 Tax=Streptomyces sp. 3N207 TaxID=3457417 RepID=UPI003FD27922